MRVLSVLTLSLSLVVSQRSHKEDTLGYGGMVSTSNSQATEAGLRVLKDGGTAADAAVAVQMVLGMVEPQWSGIGGGCVIQYFDAASDTVYNIDGREEAPNSFNPQVFCSNDSCVTDPPCDCYSQSQLIQPFYNRVIGGLSVGVPGAVAAMIRLYDTFGGNVEWSDLFDEAIDLAEQGFIVSEEMADAAIRAQFALEYFDYGYSILFDSDGNLKASTNETLTNEDYGQTMRLFRDLGSSEAVLKEFYQGTLAQAIVNTSRQSVNPNTNRSGLMTMSDIRGYRAVFRQPILSQYSDDWLIYGFSLPTSGGLTSSQLYQMQDALEHISNNSNWTRDGNSDYYQSVNEGKIYELDIYDPRTVHTMIQMLDISFSDRNYYDGDTDFVNVPISGMINQTYNRERLIQWLSDRARGMSEEDRVTHGIPPFMYYNDTSNNGTNTSSDGGSQSSEIEHGTTHFTIVDQWGNMASITSTVESLFGCTAAVPGYGFWLNNQLTDFDNLGIVEETDDDGNVVRRQVANAPEGGKRRRKTALDLFGYEDSQSEGGKRPRSSMSPTLVFQVQKKDNRSDSSYFSSLYCIDEEGFYTNQTACPVRPYLAIGSPGGSHIISTVWHTLSRILFWDYDLQAATDSYRLWSFNTGQIEFESGMIQSNPQLLSDLVSMFGYNRSTQFTNHSSGSVHTIKIGNSTVGFPILFGASDYQRRQMASVEAVCKVNSYDELMMVNQTQCPSQSNNSSKSKSKGLKSWQIIAIVLSVAIFICAVMSLCWFKSRKQEESVIGDDDGPLPRRNDDNKKKKIMIGNQSRNHKSVRMEGYNRFDSTDESIDAEPDYNAEEDETGADRDERSAISNQANKQPSYV